MPIYLDEIDIAIIESIIKDGRKSFRQISRETKITTPTVKARFERLVNVGFIKGVLPIFDFNLIDNKGGEQNLIQIQNIKDNATKKENNDGDTNNDIFKIVKDKINENITTGIAINLECDFCHGPIFSKPRILKFANIERFFCCSSCKSGYSEKYKGRIESIKKRYEGNSEIKI
ncbi:MAG: winged helix-turn-helix transcriptional regulator [Thermoproteota archaeon]|nr:winged helix-turn-helix transcriptional regulator [Thermoproteota archaeon]